MVDSKFTKSIQKAKKKRQQSKAPSEQEVFSKNLQYAVKNKYNKKDKRKQDQEMKNILKYVKQQQNPTVVWKNGRRWSPNGTQPGRAQQSDFTKSDTKFDSVLFPDDNEG